MQEITITLPTETWKGIKTKYPADMAEVGPDNFIAGTQNIDTDINGVITKRPGGIDFLTSAMAHPGVDDYEAIFTDGEHWFLTVEDGNLLYTAGAPTLTLLHAGYSSLGNFEFTTYQNRVYFDNGIDAPQVLDRTATYGGVTYTAPFVGPSGVFPPSTAPVATLVVDSTTDQIPAGGHTYKVTFEYFDDEESNGGPVSNLVTNDSTHTSNDVTLAIGGYGVTARNIYRDNNDGAWLLVGTVEDNTTTTFHDTASIGTSPVPVSNGTPPTYTLIVTNFDRNFVAGVPGSPSTIFFSDPGSPNTYDLVTGSVLCNPEDPITALVVFNGKILVLNRNSMGLLLGNQTANFQYSPIPGRVGCVDNRSTQIRTISGVPVAMWLSDKGFYQYNGQSVDYISDDIEDQVNLNIQQAAQVKGRNTQDTEADFAAGTASQGIDLTDNPGFIQTIVPERVWQSEADWEGGSSLTNVSTHDGTNALKVPTAFNASLGYATDSTQPLPFTVLGIISNVLTVSSTIGMSGGDTVTQSTFTTTISSVQDSTHIVVGSSSGWVTGFAQDTSQPLNFIITDVVDGTTLNVSTSDNMANGDTIHEGAITTTITSITGPNQIIVMSTTGLIPGGTISGDIVISGTNLELPTQMGSTGETHLSTTPFSGSPFTFVPSEGNVGIHAGAQRINVGATGTITSISFTVFAQFVPFNARYSIYTDAFGVPGSELFGTNATIGVGQTLITLGTSVPVTLGTTYWLVATNINASGINQSFVMSSSTQAFIGETALFIGNGFPGVWVPAIDGFNSQPIQSLQTGYTLTGTAMSDAGQWTSQHYDTFSDSISSGIALNLTGSYPTFTTATVVVQGTNDDPTVSPTWHTTDTLTNPTGSVSLTGGMYRYWQVIITLGTTNNTVTPVVGVTTALLTFNIAGIWISEAIHTTTDATSYDSLVLNATTPAGTTATVLIATSADNITYTSFGPFGSAVVQEWAKFQITLVATSDDQITPFVTNLTFIWSLTSNLISSAIDTGATPAGWELFQSTFATNGGTVSFFVRTATTAIGLGSATFVPVTNGAFITAPINEFIQWKVVLTSMGIDVPSVDSVTINWFISIVNASRVASIFYNRAYYMAAATFGSDTNNIVFKLDDKNTWKVYQNLHIQDFTFFFNDPYYTDAVTNQIVKFLTGLTDSGTIITMDFRTCIKAGRRVPNDMDDKVKLMKEITATVKNTGAVYSVYFSTDSGNTWIQMKDPLSGLLTYTTLTDGQRSVMRMVPIYDVGIPTPGGRLVFVRIVENTGAAAEFRSMKMRAWIRENQKVNYNNG